MAVYAVFRLEKIKNSGSLRLECQHITRERIPPHANRERLEDNNFEYTTDEAMKRYEALLPPKPRKNAVHAVDFVVSATKEALQDAYKPYFDDALAWVTEKLGGEKNRLNSGIHLDESVPHLHIIMMPMRNGQLNYNSYFGGSKYQLRQLQTDFAKEVAAHYGIQRGIERSGVEYRNFKNWQTMLTKPVPGIPQGFIKLDPKSLAAGSQKYSQEVGDRYRKAFMTVIGPLAARANERDILKEEKERLMKVNSGRAKEIDALLAEKAELKRMIIENGPELDAYRARMVQEAAVEKKQKKPRDNGLGW